MRFFTLGKWFQICDDDPISIFGESQEAFIMGKILNLAVKGVIVLPSFDFLSLKSED